MSVEWGDYDSDQSSMCHVKRMVISCMQILEQDGSVNNAEKQSCFSACHQVCGSQISLVQLVLMLLIMAITPASCKGNGSYPLKNSTSIPTLRRLSNGCISNFVSYLVGLPSIKWCSQGSPHSIHPWTQYLDPASHSPLNRCRS